MNGTITYFGADGIITYTGGRLAYGDEWDEIRIDKVVIPHMLHLLMIQGLPPASVFSGDIKLGKSSIRLNDWVLAKCTVPKKWEVPYCLRDVVLVKSDTPDLTMEACMAVHTKRT